MLKGKYINGEFVEYSPYFDRRILYSKRKFDNLPYIQLRNSSIFKTSKKFDKVCLKEKITKDLWACNVINDDDINIAVEAANNNSINSDVLINEDIDHYDSIKVAQKKTYSGEVTKGSRARIKKAVDIMLQISPNKKIKNPVTGYFFEFKISFITLTIPYNERFISGKEAYNKLLKPFLQWLYKTKKVDTYIWKAERQQPLDSLGNIKHSHGQLHYHITLNEFLDYREIRNKWNYLLLKHGLSGVDEVGNIRINPNSTDVHAVTAINDLESYLIKYVAKPSYSHIKKNGIIEELPKNVKGKTVIPQKLEVDESLVFGVYINGVFVEIDRSVEGKVWDCSKNLKGVDFFKEVELDENRERQFIIEQSEGIKAVFFDWCASYFNVFNLKFHFLTTQQVANYCSWLTGFVKQKIIHNDFNDLFFKTATLFGLMPFLS